MFLSKILESNVLRKILHVTVDSKVNDSVEFVNNSGARKTSKISCALFMKNCECNVNSNACPDFECDMQNCFEQVIRLECFAQKLSSTFWYSTSEHITANNLVKGIVKFIVKSVRQWDTLVSLA